jgi:cation diffusion facilitator family transporter
MRVCARRIAAASLGTKACPALPPSESTPLLAQILPAGTPISHQASTVPAVSPQRRTALVSVVAAATLIALKLATGLAAGSLGLLSEAAHSGTDLVAALLTFFALGVAGRPADPSHPYGHGKAEHLAALAEATILVVASLAIAATAVARLVRGGHELDVPWWALAVLVIVIVVDAIRATVSLRAGRRHSSPALITSAFHFLSDLGGSVAVLVGLLAARSGYPEADAAAALFVAVLVLVGASRLLRQNVDVLMDRAEAAADEIARRAIEELEPGVELRRLRMRSAAGRHFADVVISVPPGAAVEQGHAAANAVEDAVESALPGTDVVVHVEPADASDAALRERAHAAALQVARVREIHNLTVLRVGARVEISLHLKLPGSLSLDEAHEVATELEEAIRAYLPEVDRVQTHIEPLADDSEAQPLAGSVEAESVARIVSEATGRRPRELRLVRTERGLVAFLTLGMDAGRALTEAHADASVIEERIRRAHPEIADVVVHTEP